MSNTRTFTLLTMLSAIAIIINIIESYFIPPLQFGIRFGLANTISLIAIYYLGYKEMLMVNFMRLVVANILKGLIFSTAFWVGGLGIVLSTITLIIFYFLKSSIIFSSVFSALAHSFGQMIVIIFLYNNVNIGSLLPVLVATSVISGILTGIIASNAINRLKIINK